MALSGDNDQEVSECFPRPPQCAAVRMSLGHGASAPLVAAILISTCAPGSYVDKSKAKQKRAIRDQQISLPGKGKDQEIFSLWPLLHLQVRG